jgi:hypothetical protein
VATFVAGEKNPPLYTASLKVASTCRETPPVKSYRESHAKADQAWPLESFSRSNLDAIGAIDRILACFS